MNRKPMPTLFYKFYLKSADAYNTKAKIIIIVAICALTVSLLDPHADCVLSTSNGN